MQNEQIKTHRPLVVVLIAIVWTCFSAQESQADLVLCNETKNRVGVAIGYHNAQDWISEGWWTISGGSCNILLKGDLSARYYYIHATDYDEYRTWEGSARLCTSNQEFIIVGRQRCVERDFDEEGFREVDVGEATDWTYKLTPGIANTPKP